MKPKEIFGLAVRIIGLIFLYQGLSAVPNAIASICPVFPHFFFRNLWPSFLLIAWPVFLGYWLVRGAPWLMRLAYGEPLPESQEGAVAPSVPSRTLPHS